MGRHIRQWMRDSHRKDLSMDPHFSLRVPIDSPTPLPVYQDLSCRFQQNNFYTFRRVYGLRRKDENKSWPRSLLDCLGMRASTYPSTGRLFCSITDRVIAMLPMIDIYISIYLDDLQSNSTGVYMNEAMHVRPMGLVRLGRIRRVQSTTHGIDWTSR